MTKYDSTTVRTTAREKKTQHTGTWTWCLVCPIIWSGYGDRSLLHMNAFNDVCESRYALVMNGYGNARFEERIYLSLLIEVGICYLSPFHFSRSGTQPAPHYCHSSYVSILLWHGRLLFCLYAWMPARYLIRNDLCAERCVGTWMQKLRRVFGESNKPPQTYRYFL